MRLPFDIGEQLPVIPSLQPFLDEGAQNDLKTHGQLELRRRLARTHSGLIENVLGHDEQDFRLVREHRTSLVYTLTVAPLIAMPPAFTNTRITSHDGSNSNFRIPNLGDAG